MQYAIAKLHFRDPPSPRSSGEGLVQVISSFCSHIVKLKFIVKIKKKQLRFSQLLFYYLINTIPPVGTGIFSTSLDIMPENCSSPIQFTVR